MNARRRILDNQAICGRHRQAIGPLQVGIGVRLSTRNVARCDQMMRSWQARRTNAHFGKWPRAGGYHRPAIGRESAEKFQCAGQGDDAFQVFNFAPLHFTIFGFGIRAGQEFTQGGKAGPSVGPADNFLGLETVFKRPTGPDALYGRSGIDKHAIQIEQHGTTWNPKHFKCDREAVNLK